MCRSFVVLQMMQEIDENDRKVTASDVERIANEAREAHLQKYLAETDRALTDALVQKYRGVVPLERLDAIAALPTRFQERSDFDRSLAEAGGKPVEGGKVLGYSRFTDEAAHVSVDHLEIPKTIAHERLHQLSDPRVVEQLGKPLYEGLTEDLAKDVIGTESPKDLAPCYPVECAVAHEMRDLAGDNAVERAYFAGNATELRQKLDEQLGPGGLEKLQRQIAELAAE